MNLCGALTVSKTSDRGGSAQAVRLPSATAHASPAYFLDGSLHFDGDGQEVPAVRPHGVGLAVDPILSSKTALASSNLSETDADKGMGSLIGGGNPRNPLLALLSPLVGLIGQQCG